MKLLEIKDLSKAYGRIQAVENLCLEIAEGETFGLLGPNGSGKTTTLGMLLGIITPDRGSFRWFGEPPNSKVRRKIGSLLESPNFYPYLSAHDNLKIIAHIKKVGKPDLEHVLREVGLYERRNSLFSTFSLGMKQRLAIGAALVGNPAVLVLDEPTNGLDPMGIAEIRSIIQRLVENGKTVLFASHILDEVEKICSRVAIMKNGKLLATGPVGAILKPANQLEASAADNEMLRTFLQTIEGIQDIHVSGKFIRATLENNLSGGDINRLAFQNGLVLTHLKCSSISLEQEYLEITQSE